PVEVDGSVVPAVHRAAAEQPGHVGRVLGDVDLEPPVAWVGAGGAVVDGLHAGLDGVPLVGAVDVFVGAVVVVVGGVRVGVEVQQHHLHPTVPALHGRGRLRVGQGRAEQDVVGRVADDGVRRGGAGHVFEGGRAGQGEREVPADLLRRGAAE